VNWPELFVSEPAPAIGWKRLGASNTNAKQFIQANTDLPIVRLALQMGEAGTYVPNFADQDSSISLQASFFFLNELLAQIPRGQFATLSSGQEAGARFENKIAEGLRALVAARGLPFLVASSGSHPEGLRASFNLTDYWPFRQAPTSLDDPAAEEIYRRMGRGHLIEPDVVVWKDLEKEFSSVSATGVESSVFPVKVLIACISGKATIRSDRSQSSRYEGSTITRWRRARAPHFVVATAEPTPQRLGSLAWGLGEIDCVYHVSTTALFSAVSKYRARLPRTEESAVGEMAQLITSARIRDFSQLFDDLFAEVI
jgi:hypothetical protein